MSHATTTLLVSSSQTNKICKVFFICIDNDLIIEQSQPDLPWENDAIDRMVLKEELF